MADAKVKALGSRICDKEARLGRSQPKQSVEFEIKLEKKSEITYGQPKGQPVGAWWSVQVGERESTENQEENIEGEMKALFPLHADPLQKKLTASTKHLL